MKFWNCRGENTKVNWLLLFSKGLVPMIKATKTRSNRGWQNCFVSQACQSWWMKLDNAEMSRRATKYFESQERRAQLQANNTFPNHNFYQASGCNYSLQGHSSRPTDVLRVTSRVATIDATGGCGRSAARRWIFFKWNPGQNRRRDREVQGA